MSLLQSSFIQRAFIISLIIAVLSSVLSIFIVLKKVALIGDGLSHTAFGGLALGYYLSTLFAGTLAVTSYVNAIPQWVAGVTVVLGSIGINKALRSTKISGDAAVAVFLQLGLAGGIVLLGLSKGYGVNLDSLLFGSILVVSWDQILISAAIAAVTLGLIFVVFKEMVFVTFDETQARAAGLRTWVYDYMLSILAGLVVVIAIPVVGVLLISSLLVLPALTSTQLACSFRQTVALSPIIGVAMIALGILLSVAIDVAPGGAIVLMGLAILAAVLVGKRVFGRLRNQSAR